MRRPSFIPTGYVSLFILVGFIVGLCRGVEPGSPSHDMSLLDGNNLVAWCIVPFDAKQRGPLERAEMLERLGISRVAYDWRAKHVPTFRDEVVAYRDHDLEFFAFWSWHDALEPLIEEFGIRPQIWQMLSQPQATDQEAKITEAVKSILPLVEKTRHLKLPLAIYNHGGWSGEPENMVAVCRRLREQHDAEHVGIVYNFHHGHAHQPRFANAFELMKPYLFCVNLNGMVDPGQLKPNNKILPIGKGDREVEMIDVVLNSGYNGPIGILDHRSEVDAEISLRQNLQGLRDLTAGR